MKFTKKDYQDLLKLADIIEKKDFFNHKNFNGKNLFNLPEDKRDRSQFNLGQYFFNCGMPACAAGHAIYEFPKRFRRLKVIDRRLVDNDDFAIAFNLEKYEAIEITQPHKYSGANPKPKTVAKRIRVIAQKALEAKP